MKRFEFRFKSVEKVRKLEMERQAKAVSLAQIAVERINLEISELDSKIRSEIERIDDLVKQARLNEEMRELSVQYRENLRRQIRIKKHELLEAKQKVVLETRELIERQKKKKALELLREKEEEKYYDELSKMEAKELDEVTSQYLSYRRRHSK